MLTAKKWLTVAALALCLLFGCAALADEAVKAAIGDRTVVRVIAVPKRIVNIVVK